LTWSYSVWTTGMAYGPTHTASCPSRWLSCVCKILILLIDTLPPLVAQPNALWAPRSVDEGRTVVSGGTDRPATVRLLLTLNLRGSGEDKLLDFLPYAILGHPRDFCYIWHTTPPVL